MSFYVFSGNDRVKIQEKIQKIFGEDYEVFEGGELDATSLMEICASASLFAAERRVLIKDITPVKTSRESTLSDSSSHQDSKGFEPYEILAKYADTPHTIVIWETTLSRKKTFKDFCKLPRVKQEKIDTTEKVDRFAIFRLFDEAMGGGEGIVEKYRAMNSDPYMTVGALASWSINKYKFRFGAREKRIIKAVAELDMQTKRSKIAPDLLVEAFLARLARI